MYFLKLLTKIRCVHSIKRLDSGTKAYSKKRDDQMDYQTHDALDRAVMAHMEKDEKEEAVALLEEGLERFPVELFLITNDLVYIYSLMGENYEEKILEVLEYGNKYGCFYYIKEEDERWSGLRAMDRFQRLVAKNKALREEKQAKSTMTYDVVLPEAYDAEKSYPLHIALHGWGESGAFFQRYWTSEKLNEDYITLFVQSSQVVTSEGYSWDDTERAEMEILSAYREVVDQYPVDTDRVVIGGFSQGGTTSLDLLCREVIPCDKYVVLCPDRPESCTPDAIDQIKDIEGTILTGEHDPCLENQKQLVADIEKQRIAVNFTVIEGLGHWFPENLSALIDKALT